MLTIALTFALAVLFCGFSVLGIYVTVRTKSALVAAWAATCGFFSIFLLIMGLYIEGRNQSLEETKLLQSSILMMSR